MVLEVLRDVLDADYRGPRAVFTEVDVLKALTAIGDAGSLGRGRLGIVTGLGQGEVRTLIKRLKDRGLIIVETGGCRLSKKGEKEYGKISSLLVLSGSVDARNLKLGTECWVVLVRDAARFVRYGIEQRDAAIRAGADGAFTAVFRDGRFTVPGEGADCENRGPGEPWTTVRKSDPKEGDVVVVTGSGDIARSEKGALAAVLTIL